MVLLHAKRNGSLPCKIGNDHITMQINGRNTTKKVKLLNYHVKILMVKISCKINK